MSPAKHSLKKAVPPTPQTYSPTLGRLICMATREARRVDDDDDDDDDNDAAAAGDDDSAFLFSESGHVRIKRH